MIEIRPATRADFEALIDDFCGVRADMITLQMRFSKCYAIEDGRGLACAGGVFFDPVKRERIIWLHVARPARARTLAEGCRRVIDAQPRDGRPLVAEVDPDNARDIRFMEWLGFRNAGRGSSAPGAPPILPAAFLRMERA